MTQEGAGASPVVLGDKVVVNCDSSGTQRKDDSGKRIRGVMDGNAYTIAVDRGTGETIWKQERPFFF